MRMKLLTDEKILVECKHHWSLFLFPLVFVIIALIFFHLDSILELISFIFFSLAIGTYLWCISRFFSHRYVLTNKRLIIIESWFGRSTTDVLLDKIEGVNIKTMPLLPKIGTMTILCTGGSKYRYKTINHPQRLRDRLITPN